MPQQLNVRLLALARHRKRRDAQEIGLAKHRCQLRRKFRNRGILRKASDPTAATISELIIRLRDLENVASILVTHEMDTVKYITSAYAAVDEKGEVTVEEEVDNFCLNNTKILMLREGRVIFSGTNEEFVQSADPYIQKFISGTEMDSSHATPSN